MKTLFKLKNIPYSDKGKHLLPQEAAERYYAWGHLPFDTFNGSGSVYISSGFYTNKLTFVEWLDRYKIVIL